MNNPANEKQKVVIPPGYKPLGQAQKRLEVPERPGYHRRWIRGEFNRISRAQQAGYTFVDQSDVDVNNFDIGGDAKDSGNSDLGTRVSVTSGDDIGPHGQPGRMYLMEIPEELYEHGRSFLEERNDAIAEALRGGTSGSDEEKDKRYVSKKEGLDFFNRKPPRRP